VRKPWKFIQKRNKNKKQKIELIKNMSSFWKSYYVQQNPESKPWNICT
jgi:transcription elongation factor GreA-like protein